MRSPLRLVCALGLAFAAIASAGMDGGGKPPRFHHASLAAYPGSTISLKDPETGMTFYVESDGRRLIALDRDGALAWGLDLFSEADFFPSVGKPVIRHLKVDKGQLWATCGKHDSARIDIATGKAEYAGAD